MSTGNAYRYLFPIGCLNGMLGAALWIALQQGWIEYYPAPRHANLMIGGFLFSYALGFLWTAVPRFLRAPEPGRGELTLLVTTMALTPVLGMLSDTTFFYAAMLIGLLRTAQFGRRRFCLRRNEPPPSFVFLMAGVLLAIASLFVLMLSTHVKFPPLLEACARTFFLKGFLLCLVLGVGMKLVPVLLGWQPVPASSEAPFRIDPLSAPILLALLLGVGLEAAGEVRWAGLAYSASLATAAFARMRLSRLPRTRSALAIGVWTSGLAVVISPLSLAYDPGFAVHFWHLLFISGLGLLTLFVSVRVVLAHSGQEFLRWERSPALYLMGGLVLLASLTRVSAPMLAPQHIFTHYAYAAALWIGALAIWAWYFVRFTPTFAYGRRKGGIASAA